VPGPGNYTIRNLDGGVGFRFSKNERGFSPSQEKFSLYPGPGQYDLKPYFADVPKYLMVNSKPNI
jgi:hypothetical protein